MASAFDSGYSTLYPVRVERGIPGQLVAVDQLRDALGLYGDTSLDDRLTSALAAATDKVASLRGESVTGEDLVAFYPRLARILLCPDVRIDHGDAGIITTTVAVTYYDQDNALQTIDPADYWIDESGPGVGITSARVAQANYFDGREYPVSVRWRNADGIGAPGADTRKEAVLAIAQAIIDGENVDRAVRTASLLLGGARAARVRSYPRRAA